MTDQDQSAAFAPITAIDALEAIYGRPNVASTVKQIDYISRAYRRFVEAAPFAVLATSGPEGLDASPRGDRPGFARVVDARTVMLPDRRGNNRIDSLRNVVRDPRVALLFLIPGAGNTLRINGTAAVTADPALCASFAVDGRPPRTVLVVTVAEVYFQCARALIRSRLWDPEARIDPDSLPSPGAILDELSDGGIDAETYDAEWPGRAVRTMW